jgi:uncharacterized glyoxalase superfamily protein PhnB
VSSFPDFTFAHAGLNVADRDACAQWYVNNLNLSIVRSVPGNMIFLADPNGRVVLEIYSNPAAPVLAFDGIHFLSLHLAFLVEDPAKKADELIAAGAAVAEDYKITDAGDRMIMLRDPYGVCVQLIKRQEPMF